MSIFVWVFIAGFICCCVPLVHAPKQGPHIANQDDLCEVYIDQSNTCYLQRNVGDRVDLQIALSDQDLDLPAERISWYRRLKIHNSSSMLVSLNDTGHLPRNMDLSPGGLRLTIHQLREYDMSGNGLKAWMHGRLQLSQSKSFVNFVIEPLPIDLGDPLPGEPISINIADYFSLPDLASYAVWHKEGSPPETKPREALLSEGGGHFEISHLTSDDYGIYACEVYSSESYFVVKKRFQIGDVDTQLSLHHSADHPIDQEKYSNKILHHRQIARHYDQQMPVSVKVANPKMCSYHLPSSHLCIITVPMMLMGSCDLWLEVNITGPYRVDQVVWSKFWAKLNRHQSHSNQFEAEEVPVGVSADGRRKQVWCDEGDFSENYFSVQVKNGHIPIPSFTFKIMQEPIELGPLVLGHPFELNTYYHGIYPHPDWIGKWVHEDIGNFTVLDPPYITHEYRVDQLGIHDVGLLTYLAYENYNGYQVATRRFHSEADVDECSTGLHSCPDTVSYCENTLGSYTCLCVQGFTGDGWNCVDVNECADPLLHNCNTHADCVNTIGSFHCTCHSGYHGDGMTCDPIACPLLEELLNGRVEMQGHSFGDMVQFVCNDGYKMEGSGVLMCLDMSQWSGGMPKCHDIDECDGINECSVNAKCTNTPGSYECDCVEGYEGDGFTCQDVNECSFEVSPCPSQTTCTNMEGGYSCICFHAAGEVEGVAAQCQASPIVYTYEDVLNSEKPGSNGNVFYDSYYEMEIGHLREDNTEGAGHDRNDIVGEVISNDENIDNEAGTALRADDFDDGQRSEFGSGSVGMDFGDLPPLVAGNDWNEDIEEDIYRGKRENFSVDEYVYAEEGSTYQLSCQPASLDTEKMVDIETQWVSKDGKPLTNERYLILEGGELEIAGVVPQDSGVLMCKMSYGDYVSGMIERDVFTYVLTVFTLPLMFTSVSVQYHIKNCGDDYDNNIWQEIFHTALKLEVCHNQFCDVQQFDTECLDVQEENEHVGVILQHELVFKAKLLVNDKDLQQCSMTCMVGELYNNVELIVGKLQRYTETETGQLASYPSLGFHVVKGSLQNQVELACAEGHGLHEDVCVACEPGNFSPTDAVDCRQCDKGSYQPKYAASACTPCPAGHSGYHPGAIELKQCHAKGWEVTLLLGIGLGGLIGLLFLAFTIYKILKKCRIKSQGVKLPGLDLGKDVDLLANMHDVDERKHKKKSKRKIKWGDTEELAIIPEEHVALIPDVESPRKEELDLFDLTFASEEEVQHDTIRRHTEKEADISDGERPHVALQLVNEDDSTSQFSSVTEVRDDLQRAASETHSAGSLKRPSHFESDLKRTKKSRTDQVSYATLDHTKRSSGHMGQRKSRSYHEQDLDITSTVSTSSSSSSSITSSGTSSETSSSTSAESLHTHSSITGGESLLGGHIQQSTSSASSTSSVSYGREASAIVVSETTEEHVPIFPSEKTPSIEMPPSDEQQSHTVLVLDSMSRHASEFVTGQTELPTSPERVVSRVYSKGSSPHQSLSSIRHASSRQSFASSLQLLPPKHSFHLSPPSGRSPTASLTSRSQEHISPRASSSARHAGSPRRPSSLESERSHTKSPILLDYASIHGSPTHRTPSISSSSARHAGSPRRPSSLERSQEQISPRAFSSARHAGSPRSPSSVESERSRTKSPILLDHASIHGSPTHRTPSISHSVHLTRKTSPPPVSPPRSTTHLPINRPSSAGRPPPPPPPPPLPDFKELFEIKSPSRHRRSSVEIEIVNGKSSMILSPPPELSISTLPGRSTSGFQQQRSSRHMTVNAGSTALILDEMPSEHPGSPRPPVSPARVSSVQRQAVSRQSVLEDIRGLSSEEVRKSGSKSPSLLRTTSEAIGRQTLLQDIADLRKDDFATEDVTSNLLRESLSGIPATMTPAPPPPGSLELIVTEAPSSTGRAALLGDIQNLGREDYVSEDVSNTTGTTLTEVQKSRDKLPPPPSSKPPPPLLEISTAQTSAPPSSASRGALLGDIQKQRRDNDAVASTSRLQTSAPPSSASRGALLGDIQKQRRYNDAVASTSRLQTSAPPSSASRGALLGDIQKQRRDNDAVASTSRLQTSAPPSSASRGALLGDIQKQRRDNDTVASTSRLQTSAPPSSASRGALLGDIQKQRRDDYLTEVVPSTSRLQTSAPPSSASRGALLGDIQKQRRDNDAVASTSRLQTSAPPSSASRGALLGDIQKQRRDDYAVPSTSRLQTSAPPSSASRGALLGDIQKQRTDDYVTEAMQSTSRLQTSAPPSSPSRGALLGDIQRQRRDDYAVPSTSRLQTSAPPSSASRGALLGDIQKQRTDDYVTEAMQSTSRLQTSAPPSSPSRGALLGDIQRQRRDDYVTEAVPSTSHLQSSTSLMSYQSTPPPPPPTGATEPQPPITSNSAGRGALLGDIQKRRRDDCVSEGMPSSNRPPLSTSPSKGASGGSAPAPSPAGRGALLGDIQKRRRDDCVSEGMSSSNRPPLSTSPSKGASGGSAPAPSPAGRGALLGDIQKRRRDDCVSEGVPSSSRPPPSTSPASKNGPPTPSKGAAGESTLAPPSSAGRGALLDDIQKRRRDDCVSEGVSSSNSERLLPPSRPPPSPATAEAKPLSQAPSSSSSPGRLSLLKDINKMRRTDCVTEGTPTKSGHGRAANDQEWFSCVSEPETSPPKKAGGAPPPPPPPPPPLIF